MGHFWTFQKVQGLFYNCLEVLRTYKDKFVIWKVQLKTRKRTKVQLRIFRIISECWIVIQLLKSDQYEFKGADGKSGLSFGFQVGGLTLEILFLCVYMT